MSKSTRVRFLATLVNGHPFSSDDFSNERRENDIPLARIRDIKNPEFTTFIDREQVPDDVVIQNGDLVIGMDGDFNSKIWGKGPAALNQRMCLLRSPDSKDLRFISYAISDQLKLINEFTYSTTVKHLSSEQVLGLPLPSLDLKQRHDIADYLDRETAEIDGMRADLDEMERLLTERRAAFIGSAVRQVSSLGKKVSLQSVASIHAGDTITSSEITKHGEYRVYGGNGVRGYCDRANQLEDRVLVGRQGALCGNVHLARGPFYASEHTLVVEPRIEVCLDWLKFVLQDQKLGQLSMSAAQPGITASAVGLQIIQIPPLSEQRRIADEIDRETAEIDSMLEDITELRDLLAERRAAVISAAVTGQIDIPASLDDKDEPHA